MVNAIFLVSAVLWAWGGLGGELESCTGRHLMGCRHSRLHFIGCIGVGAQGLWPSSHTDCWDLSYSK